MADSADFGLQLGYLTGEAIPVGELAEALLALDRILRKTSHVMGALTDSKISGVEVYITGLHEGSLYEDLVVKFLFGGQDSYERFIGEMRKLTGLDHIMDDNSKRGRMLGAIVAVMIFTGGAWSVGRMGTTPALINANNTVIIQMGAAELNMSAEKFEGIVRTAISEMGKRSQTQLREDAVGVVKPARVRPGSSMTLSTDGAYLITEDAIQSFPSESIPDEPEDVDRPYDRVEVFLRALDLDSGQKGWAAVIPEISERRCRLVIGANDMGKLYGRKSVFGKVVVTYRMRNNSMTPVLYSLISFED